MCILDSECNINKMIFKEIIKNKLGVYSKL